jgi:hypothetical protein
MSVKVVNLGSVKYSMVFQGMKIARSYIVPVKLKDYTDSHCVSEGPDILEAETADFSEK